MLSLCPENTAILKIRQVCYDASPALQKTLRFVLRFCFCEFLCETVPLASRTLPKEGQSNRFMLTVHACVLFKTARVSSFFPCRVTLPRKLHPIDGLYQILVDWLDRSCPTDTGHSASKQSILSDFSLYFWLF